MATSQQNSFRWPLFGNEHVRSYFESALANDALNHCYLLSGPAGVGKISYAKAVATMALCTARAIKGGVVPCGRCSSCRNLEAQADVAIVRVSEKKQRIGVETIRGFIAHLETGTFGAPLKIGIIEAAELLTSEAANALLKTLEEPAARRLIIMTATHHEHVPATIVSRSQLVRFRPVPREAVYDYLVQERGASRDFAKMVSELSFGRPAWAVRWSENDARMKDWLEQVQAFRASAAAPLHERLQHVATAIASFDMPTETMIAWQAVVREKMLAAVGVVESEDALFGAPQENAHALARAAMQAHTAPRYLRANVGLQPMLEHLTLQLPS